MAGSGIKDSVKKASYVSEEVYFHELNLKLIRNLNHPEADSDEEHLPSDEQDDHQDEAA